jgi:hypothetical protein
MAYPRRLRSAAARHFRDAKILADAGCFDNAGYHLGLSAECALKAAMEAVGIRVDQIEVDGRDPYFTHFPRLKRNPAHYAGRLSQSIATMLGRANFLQNWEINMRYAHDHAINKRTVDQWLAQVHEFNNQCGGI